MESSEEALDLESSGEPPAADPPEDPEPAPPVPELSLPAPELALPEPESALPGPEFALPGPELALPGPEFALPGPEFALPGPELSPEGALEAGLTDPDGDWLADGAPPGAGETAPAAADSPGPASEESTTAAPLELVACAADCEAGRGVSFAGELGDSITVTAISPTGFAPTASGTARSSALA
ncbi:MAG: hypothetical protein HY671_12705 [Chloroflexi bacterium]|nr:hypothetical protein [Chloroflexota bacterium]